MDKPLAELLQKRFFNKDKDESTANKSRKKMNVTPGKSIGVQDFEDYNIDDPQEDTSNVGQEINCGSKVKSRVNKKSRFKKKGENKSENKIWKGVTSIEKITVKRCLIKLRSERATTFLYWQEWEWKEIVILKYMSTYSGFNKFMWSNALEIDYLDQKIIIGELEKPVEEVKGKIERSLKIVYKFNVNSREWK